MTGTEQRMIEELCKQMSSEGIDQLIYILEVELRERTKGENDD